MAEAPGPKPYIEHDGYLIQYVPDSTLEGFHAIHFCAKRTYRMAPFEKLQPARWQRTFVTADQHFEGAGPYETSVRTEAELGPPKTACDVIINALCYAPGGEATYCYPEVQINQHLKKLIVIGNRIAIVDREGKVQFTPADKFSVLPIRYEYAYGGVDTQHSMGPVMSATNPLGRGFLMAPLDDDPPRNRWTALPNIEDPDDLIQQTNLLTSPMRDTPGRLPAGFGWIPKYWEPRSNLAGMPENVKPLWQLLMKDQPKMGEQFREMQPDFWNGAPAGLTLPIEGFEKVMLRHVHREHEQIDFLLPADTPNLRVAINDEGMQGVTMTLNTMQIEIEAGEVILGWRGTLPVPDLDEVDDLKRVLLEVDGQLTLPAPLLGTGFPIDLLTGEFPGLDIDRLKALPNMSENQ